MKLRLHVVNNLQGSSVVLITKGVQPYQSEMGKVVA